MSFNIVIKKRNMVLWNVHAYGYPPKFQSYDFFLIKALLQLFDLYINFDMV